MMSIRETQQRIPIPEIMYCMDFLPAYFKNTWLTHADCHELKVLVTVGQATSMNQYYRHHLVAHYIMLLPSTSNGFRQV